MTLTVTPASTPARRQALLRWIRAVTPTQPAPQARDEQAQGIRPA